MNPVGVFLFCIGFVFFIGLTCWLARGKPNDYNGTNGTGGTGWWRS